MKFYRCIEYKKLCILIFELSALDFGGKNFYVFELARFRNVQMPSFPTKVTPKLDKTEQIQEQSNKSDET